MSAERQRGIADATLARAELYNTLGQLQERLNYAKRVDDAVDEARATITEKKRENPAVFIAGVAGVAAVAGLAVWGIASAVLKRL